MIKKDERKRWMRLALAEGRRGIGLTAPNPPVGAVIVKDGFELSRGWHKRSGGPHAERAALANLKSGEAKGSSVVVTLEPCSTRGKTGACTDALIEAGVCEVIYGCSDPNPEHRGRGAKILRDAGIHVHQGVLEDDCRSLIKGFASVQTHGRPWVIAKTAMTLDGRISRQSSEGQWITGKDSREEVQRIRSTVDAIITSGETVRQDDPALTLRGKLVPENKSQPWRVVMTNKGLERSRFQLFNDEFRQKTLFYEQMSELEVLEKLTREHQVQTVLIEAGGGLLGNFADRELVDEWIIFLAPMVVGGPVPAVGGKGASELSNSLKISNLRVEQFGRDLCLRGTGKS